jgi:thiol reductant ABC exporter CydC subunit
LAPVGRTVGLARAERRPLALATLLGAGCVGSGIALLGTSAWLISRAAERPEVSMLALAVVAVRLFAISRGLFRYGERLVGHNAALRELADLRVTVYEQLERLAPAGPGFRRGDLLTRLVRDVDTVQDLMVRVLPPCGVAVVVGASTVGVVWLLLPAAGVVLASALLFAATVAPWLARTLARRSEARRAVARAELATEVVDLLDGLPDLVANDAASAQLARVMEADAELTRVAAATSHNAGVGSALATLLTGLAVWGAVLVGVPAVDDGRLAPVLLAVIVLIPLAAFELVGGLPAAAQAFEGVRRSAARLFAVLDARPLVADPAAPAILDAPRGVVRVRGLQVRYGDGPWVLDGVDLDLTPGRKVAVVGPSGAGKTTLASVLLRFVPYGGGSVSLDGVELDTLAGDDVRSVIGLVEQDAHVFTTSLRENLLLARRDATPEEVHRALGRARLLDWVHTLPDGLDTDVGEGGCRLSGGQRQRLAVARAMLAGFPVLVLDEPGEHLDVATADALLSDAVAEAGEGALLAITHRLRGLEAMDEIVVLDHGRIVERGRHADLLDLSGRYAALWEHEHRADLVACQATEVPA